MNDTGRRTAAVLSCLLGMFSEAFCGGRAVTASEPTGATGVTVVFHSLHSRAGWLRVSLYARPDGFPGDERRALRSRDIRLGEADTSGTVTVAFDGLPAGEYAVSAFHDVNGNGRLDTDRLGRPREDWAASNDPRPLFRAPRFKEARFALKSPEEKIVTLSLRH